MYFGRMIIPLHETFSSVIQVCGMNKCSRQRKLRCKKRYLILKQMDPIGFLNTSEIKNEISEFRHKFLDESHRFPETKLFYLQSYN